MGTLFKREGMSVGRLGVYHSSRWCHRCGATSGLRLVVHSLTHAQALECADFNACQRRRQDEEQRRSLTVAGHVGRVDAVSSPPALDEIASDVLRVTSPRPPDPPEEPESAAA
jgi:methylphosphotriester-DNA--protein-cysteine methyltransferase